MSPSLIALDWGTSNLRASLLDPSGHSIEQRHSAMGVMKVPPGTFDAVLVELCEFQAYAEALSSFLVDEKICLRVGRAGPQHQVQAALEMIPVGMMAVFLDDNVQSFLAGQRRCAAGELGRLISQARLRVLGNCLLCLIGRRLQCFPLV